MTAFLIGATLILVISLLLLSRPWWRQRSTGGASRQEINKSIYRDQLAELERDRSSGQLADADFQEARNEIQRRLIEDVADADIPATGGPAKRGLLAMLITLPVLGFALYALLGNPAALDQMQRGDFTQQDIDKMVADLAAKLEKEPDNLQGWIMLARSYKALRRMPEAERAYEKAWPLVEQEPQLLAEYADLLASKVGDLAGRPEELILKALQLDPNHLQSLWLAGTAAFNRDDYAKAIEYWERAQGQMQADSEDSRMLASIIAEAKQKLGGKGKAAAGPVLQGRLELAKELQDKAAPSDTLFLIAREAGGPPMPLAAKRLKVGELPLDFVFTDGDSLSADRPLSAAKAIELEARVSKSGEAKAQSGDLSGRLGPLKPGNKPLKLKIDRVLP